MCVLFAISSVPLPSDGQPCRRQCKSGESRDIRGCCVAPSKPKRKRITWYGTPGLVDTSAKGPKSIVGTYSTGTRKARRYYVGAFHGASLRQLWRKGPYREKVSVVATGKMVMVVASKQSRMLILRGSTGRVVRTIPLRSRVWRMCPNPVGGNNMYAQLSSGKGTLIDGATGAARTLANPPAWCPNKACHGGYEDYLPMKRCVRSRLQRPGHRVQYSVHVKGHARSGTWLAVGFQSYRKPRPIIERIDQGKRVWLRLVGNAPAAGAPFADVANDRIVFSYRDKRGQPRLGALKLSDGTPLWDVATAVRPETPLVTATRVYIAAAKGGPLQVFATKTGKLLRTFGTR